MDAWAVPLADPVPYDTALRWQESLHAARVAGRIPDTVLILQHAPTITLGRRGRDNFLLRAPAELEARGIAVRHASRGGDVTYHGPGQWVLYPILKLGSGGADAHGHLWNLEEVAIRTCRAFGVEATRRPGMSGAWTAQGKIAAIGFLLKRWVTLHGMSFNVRGALDGFRLIVPCGLVGQPVATLETALGAACPAMDAARDRLLDEFETVCGRTLRRFAPGAEAPPDLAAALPDLFPAGDRE